MSNFVGDILPTALYFFLLNTLGLVKTKMEGNSWRSTIIFMAFLNILSIVLMFFVFV
jgi:hypothetical protein